jgi:hypothetical protein
LIERAANGPALISELLRKFGKLIIPVDPDGRSKSARLGRHADLIIGKRIWLPAGAEWRDDFINEFIEFPNGKFTDQVDATSQFLDHAAEFAALEPAPPAGLAVVVNSAGRTRTTTTSTAHNRDRGVAAACAATVNRSPAINGVPLCSRSRVRSSINVSTAHSEQRGSGNFPVIFPVSREFGLAADRFDR